MDDFDPEMFSEIFLEAKQYLLNDFQEENWFKNNIVIQEHTVKQYASEYFLAFDNCYFDELLGLSKKTIECIEQNIAASDKDYSSDDDSDYSSDDDSDDSSDTSDSDGYISSDSSDNESDDQK